MMTAADDFGPTSHSFVSQRLRLHYLDWGNAGAPRLILQHGGRDHARSWDWVARELRNDWHIIAPDLRGHGDSAWSPDGAYIAPFYVSDMAQLIYQTGDAPVTIVAHSLGGAIALRYAGLYPETVRRLVAIEGVGLFLKDYHAVPPAERWREWIEERRGLSARLPRRYATLEEAFRRMQAENRHLSEAQARHLTIHGTSRHEDGTWSWKFDNYVRSAPPLDLSEAEQHEWFGRIACPTLLVWGEDSWVSDPEPELRHFRDARVARFARAGHWVHHDRFDAFMEMLRGFL